MTVVWRWLTAIFLVAVCGALSACGPWRASSREIEADAITNIQRFDALEYFDALDGDVGVPAGAPITEEQWRALVERQRADGLRSLDESQRLLLVRGAFTMYMTAVANAEIEISVDGFDAALVFEEYALDEEGYRSNLGARETQSEGIDVQWGDVVTRADGSIETREFVTQADGNFGSVTWSRLAGTWTCVTSESDDGYGFARAFYLHRLGALLDGEAEVVGTDMIGVRAAIRVAPGRAYPSIVWLDEVSLFPVRFEMPQDDPLLGHSIQVLGFNLDRHVKAPAESCTSS